MLMRIVAEFYESRDCSCNFCRQLCAGLFSRRLFVHFSSTVCRIYLRRMTLLNFTTDLFASFSIRIFTGAIYFQIKRCTTAQPPERLCIHTRRAAHRSATRAQTARVVLRTAASQSLLEFCRVVRESHFSPNVPTERNPIGRLSVSFLARIFSTLYETMFLTLNGYAETCVEGSACVCIQTVRALLSSQWKHFTTESLGEVLGGGETLGRLFYVVLLWEQCQCQC